MHGESWIDIIKTENDPRPDSRLPSTNLGFLGAGYFRTLHLSLRAGTQFRTATASPPSSLKASPEALVERQSGGRQVDRYGPCLRGSRRGGRRVTAPVSIRIRLTCYTSHCDSARDIRLRFWCAPHWIRNRSQQPCAQWFGTPMARSRSRRADAPTDYVRIRGATTFPDHAGASIRRCSERMVWSRIPWRGAARKSAFGWRWERGKQGCSGWCCGKA
jgi:hypothetical protein